EDDATFAVSSERHVLPVEIRDAEPRPERERLPDDRRELVSVSAEWLELQSQDEPAAPIDHERRQKIETLAEKAPERARLREHQPLPHDRARLVNEVAAHLDAPPEVVRITQEHWSVARERAGADVDDRALHQRNAVGLLDLGVAAEMEILTFDVVLGRERVGFGETGAQQPSADR